MRYNNYEQKKLDQESGQWLDEKCKSGVPAKEWDAFIIEVSSILTDNETLDRWEQERYNELKLREVEER